MPAPAHQPSLPADSTPQAVTYLRALLQTPVLVLYARVNRFGRGEVTPDEVAKTERIILLETGRLRYRIGEETLDLAAGCAVYLPPRTERRWQVTSRSTASLRWVEYQTAPSLIPPGPMLWRDCRSPSLAADLTQLAEIQGNPDPAAVLLAEALAKSVAARFFCHAEAVSPGDAAAGPVADADVQRGLAALGQHLADPAAMRRARQAARLSARQFRDRCKRATGQSPQQHLIAQRMREARRLLHFTEDSVKQIAFACGYEDPYYFSRSYRRFWGRSPSADRHARP